VIDDDPGIRSALGRLFRSVGLHAELFASANELRRHELPSVPSCLVLDVHLPGPSARIATKGTPELRTLARDLCQFRGTTISRFGNSA
jgi:FixJ family two-component response regulator